MTNDAWDYDEPTEDGWYAVLLCWDVQEGAFPSTAEYHNGAWTERAVSCFHGPFPTESEARQYAEANDPDM